MLTLPTLYKKTETGAIQFWDIRVDGLSNILSSAVIVTIYGQVGTNSPQKTEDEIKTGKNIGKKNETTPYQQAEAEALAKWTKQKKKGYVESIEAAQAEELDALIEGGIEPMLAEAYMDVVWDLRPGHENDAPTFLKTKEAKKIKFPAFGQPKLDGIRCIAIIKNGECTLWTRTRKPITSVPHIVQELEAAFAMMDITLDGELYNHEMKSDFEKIVSLVRQDEPGAGHEIVQFHVYDMVNDMPFKNRYAQLHRLFDNFEFFGIKLVQTEVIKDEDQVLPYFEKHVKNGYEGLMLRNVESLYVNKRSMDLQKIKPFYDDEFEVIGIEEGSGKLAGHVGSFVCKMKDGQEFKAKGKGATENLKKYFEDATLWMNKLLTVRYQGFTGKNRVPRFPVGITIRDYE